MSIYQSFSIDEKYRCFMITINNNKKEFNMSNKLKYDNSTLNKIALMKAIGNKIKDDNLKQREVAEILDIKQPRVSDLIRLKHERFTLDTLIGYLEIFGSIIKIEEKELVNRKSNLVDVKALKCKPKYRSIVLN